MRKIVALLIIVGSFMALPAAAYDIKNDFCGAHISAMYCKCAFHGQNCDAVNMTKSAADAHVKAEFKKWVEIQDAAKCASQGKEWSNGKCMTKEAAEKAEEKAEQKDDSKSDESVACDAGKHEVVDKEGKACECSQLYLKDKDGACAYAGSRGVRFDGESADAFQTLVTGLAEGEGRVFEGKDLKGKPLRVGVLRLPDGSYIFTSDGINFFDNAKEAASPDIGQRLAKGWTDFWRGFGRVFGVGKFSGKDTAGDAAKQRDGQFTLDAATQALTSMLEALKEDPDEDFDTATERLDTWTGRAEKLLGEEYEELTMDELGEATGLDTKTIKKIWENEEEWEKILEGKVDDVVEGLTDDAKQALIGVPAETIKLLSRELKKDDFAEAVAAYSRERRAGKKPGDILALLYDGELPELETLQLKGTGQFYGRTALFVAYEEAYQRLLLREGLAK